MRTEVEVFQVAVICFVTEVVFESFKPLSKELKNEVSKVISELDSAGEFVNELEGTEEGDTLLVEELVRLEYPEKVLDLYPDELDNISDCVLEVVKVPEESLS